MTRYDFADCLRDESWAGTVTLIGGFDCAFVSTPGFSTVIGTITLEKGTGNVIIENIVLR